MVGSFLELGTNQSFPVYHAVLSLPYSGNPRKLPWSMMVQRAWLESIENIT